MDIPIDNSTALRTTIYTGWMPASNVRSTADILWTCAATIILCVYTAVHPNIPEPGEPEGRQALRRAKWVIIAIFAPELVLQSAFKQFADALSLRDALRDEAQRLREIRCTRDSPEPTAKADTSLHVSSDDQVGVQLQTVSFQAETDLSEIPQSSEINLTYAYYAVMGGFRLKNLATETHGSLALTPVAIIAFAREGVFWNIDTGSIQDKSKADNLAKILTVLQVLWMLAQCSARAASHLPMTLLEIHTFIHAVCAAIMYLLWFKKPLNIREASIKSLSSKYDEIVNRVKTDLPVHAFVTRQFNFGRNRRGADILERPRLRDVFGTMFFIDDQFDRESPWWDMGNFAGIFLIQVLYGGVHMLAWNQHFASVFEKWAWRSSCIIIAGGPFIVTIATFAYAATPESLDFIRVGQTATGLIFTAAFLLVIGPVAGTWVFARGFIVIESLIGIRSVAIGVYESVPWSNYIPHI